MKRKNYILTCAIMLTGLLNAQTGVTHPDSITTGSPTRTYTYYVPTIYGVKDTLVPLIINVHGLTGSSNSQETAEDFRKIADTANFIVLHPQAIGVPGILSTPQTSWDVWNTIAAGAADRDFIIQALDSVSAHYKIDSNRIYVTGFSQGGYMSYNLSTIYSERITAMASVAGAMSNDYYNGSYPVHPLPVMEIHGTNDQLVSYTGGGNGQPVETTVGHWIQFNNCNTTPEVAEHLPNISSADQCQVYHYKFTGGCKGASVEFYRIQNGGHQIPSKAPVPTGYGIGNTNQDFTAAKEIWRFFSQYRLDSLYDPLVPEAVCVALADPAPTPPAIPAPTALGIDNISASSTISIYPNPASTGVFNVESKFSGVSIISVVNLLGEAVYSSEFSGKTIVDISDMPKGIYIYSVSSNNGEKVSGKLIMQ